MQGSTCFNHPKIVQFIHFSHVIIILRIFIDAMSNERQMFPLFHLMRMGDIRRTEILDKTIERFWYMLTKGR